MPGKGDVLTDLYKETICHRHGVYDCQTIYTKFNQYIDVNTYVYGHLSYNLNVKGLTELDLWK